LGLGVFGVSGEGNEQFNLLLEGVVIESESLREREGCVEVEEVLHHSIFDSLRVGH